MKKILFYILVLSGALIISCSDSSGTTSEAEYIQTDFTAKNVDSTIYYSAGIAGGCTAGTGCQAIIYQGEVSDIDYVGIAIKNTSHSVKIYWAAKSIPTGTTLNISGCTIKYDDASVTNQTINVDIAATTSDTYTITFNSAVTVGSYSISSGAIILAQLY